MKGTQFHRLVAVAAAGAAVMAMSACGSTSSGGGAAKQPPTAGMKPQTSVAATGAGAFDLLGWGGYLQTPWPKTFGGADRWQDSDKDARPSDEVGRPMAKGGTRG